MPQKILVYVGVAQCLNHQIKKLIVISDYFVSAANETFSSLSFFKVDLNFERIKNNWSLEKPYSKLVIFNITVPLLSMSTSPIVLSPSSSVGTGNKSQRTHTTVEWHISPGCGLSSHRVFKKGTVWGPEWLAQAGVMSLPYLKKLGILDPLGAVNLLMGCLRKGLFGVQSDWHKLLWYPCHIWKSWGY